MTRVVVAGSGRMGRDVGVTLAARGLHVTWLSRDAERLARLRERTERRARRAGGTVAYTLEMPDADVLIEAVEEDADTKRAVLAALAPRAGLVLTNTSSFLPETLHPRAVAMHFFAPVELTGVVELIRGDDAARAFAAAAGLRVVEETAESAFLANRLLLPLQEAAFRLLRAGADPVAVDDASRSDLLPIGVLTLMDHIGLPVLAAATHTYASRMKTRPDALVDGLAELVALGKRDRADGILQGRPLPWPRQEVPVPADLGDRLAWAAASACRLLPRADVALLLTRVWGAPESPVSDGPEVDL